MSNPVSAILLSGGRGSRFGNRDKGLAAWRDKPLIEHVIERLRGQADQIIISCNRNREQYQALGFQLCSDGSSDYLGPLAGILAATPMVEHSHCLICPNDTPRLPEDLVARLSLSLLDNNAQIAYPVCHDRHHYLPALLRSEILASAGEYLSGGGRSVRGWYMQFRCAVVDFSDETDQFANVNSPEALDELDS